jgi:hypothetical protein
VVPTMGPKVQFMSIKFATLGVTCCAGTRPHSRVAGGHIFASKSIEIGYTAGPSAAAEIPIDGILRRASVTPDR